MAIALNKAFVTVGAAFILTSTGTQLSSLPVQTILIDCAC